MEGGGSALTRLAGEGGRLSRRVRAGAVIVLVLAGAAVAVLVSAISSAGTTTVLPAVPLPSWTGAAAPRTDVVMLVHVLGAVRRPGLYPVSQGARVVDVVAAAGGFTEEADQAGVNLARLVADGEQVRVPAIGEAPAVEAGGGEGGRIDLNSATAEELDALPRIGPAIAERIVQWRQQNGPYASADDLLEVSGIGEKTVDGIRDLVLP
jgi:competence protein ComEA